MSIEKGLFGAVGLSLLAIGLQLPAQAQTAIATAEPVIEADSASESITANDAIENLTFSEPYLQIADLTFSEEQAQTLVQTESLTEATVLKTEEQSTKVTLPAEALVAVNSEARGATQPVTEAAELGYPAVEAAEEVAQIRRRTRASANPSANYIGIGADFGYVDDVSFAAISKFSLTEQIAVRPSVLIGDDFSVLVPVTYEFSRFNTNAGGFQLRPYAGAGVSFSDSDDDSDINLLLSGGVDIPVSQRFTVNGQVNWGVLNDSQFGVTVGIGYNLGGNIFQ